MPCLNRREGISSQNEVDLKNQSPYRYTTQETTYDVSSSINLKHYKWQEAKNFRILGDIVYCFQLEEEEKFFQLQGQQRRLYRGKRGESIRFRIKVRVRQITGLKNKLNQHLRQPVQSHSGEVGRARGLLKVKYGLQVNSNEPPGKSARIGLSPNVKRFLRFLLGHKEQGANSGKQTTATRGVYQ